MNQSTPRVELVRETVAAASTPDGERSFATNLLPRACADTQDVVAEISPADTRTLKLRNMRLPHGSTIAFRICISHDGRYAYAAVNWPSPHPR